ncbi:MAG: flagellar basal-body rod protein FlgF [Pseudomonas fluorescens]|nr:MAG: flagellar basal-body rod protein FlgF [Pseudomonas fluorescens]
MQEISVLASRVLTSQRRYDTVADNVANLNTSGYRKLELEFQETISRPSNKATASYVSDRAVHVSQQQGDMEATNNPFDVAIGGEGFFAIDVNGTTQYTRRGQFVVNNEGILVTPEGNPVLDNGGAQIQIPQNSKTVTIAGDGAISSEAGQIGQMGVYTFSPADMKKLERAGTSAFIPMLGAAAVPMENARVRQGFLEGSNAKATEEMVNMQMVSKAYETSLKLLKGMEDLESQAIRSLGTQ